MIQEKEKEKKKRKYITAIGVSIRWLATISLREQVGRFHKEVLIDVMDDVFPSHLFCLERVC